MPKPFSNSQQVWSQDIALNHCKLCPCVWHWGLKGAFNQCQLLIFRVQTCSIIAKCRSRPMDATVAGISAAIWSLNLNILCRERNSMDVALYERGQQLLDRAIKSQRESGSFKALRSRADANVSEIAQIRAALDDHGSPTPSHHRSRARSDVKPSGCSPTPSWALSGLCQILALRTLKSSCISLVDAYRQPQRCADDLQLLRWYVLY